MINVVEGPEIVCEKTNLHVIESMQGENACEGKYKNDSSFCNFADANSTVELEQNTNQTNLKTAIVVGEVRDYDTEEVIEDAKVFIEDVLSVKTDQNGRFRVDNLPSGTYIWKVSAENYCCAEYLNYSVDSEDGVTIFTFYISQDFELNRDRLVILSESLKAFTLPPNTVDKGNFRVAKGTTRMSSVPTASNGVTVRYNGNNKRIDRQTYIYTVLSSELYETSYYLNLGMTYSQIQELYCAQAMAANTYLEYSMKVYSKHSGSGYDVCSTSCCQVYDPTKVTQAAMETAGYIFYSTEGVRRTNIVMYHPSSAAYEYIWGAFFSSCGNAGTKSHSSQPALVAVACTDIATGYGGHRYGLCQMGAAYLAKQGMTSGNILKYYYSGCIIAACRLE